MLFNHADINERMWTILVEWMVEVAAKFKLNDETIHRSVAICLEYMRCTAKQIKRSRLQLLGVTSLHVACKLHEVVSPLRSDLEYICNRACTASEIKALETELLQMDVLRRTAWQIIAQTSNNSRALQAANVSILSFRVASQSAHGVAIACGLVANDHFTRCQSKRIHEDPIAEELMKLCQARNDIVVSFSGLCLE